jgi:hypothetical protein
MPGMPTVATAEPQLVLVLHHAPPLLLQCHIEHPMLHQQQQQQPQQIWHKLPQPAACAPTDDLRPDAASAVSCHG